MAAGVGVTGRAGRSRVHIRNLSGGVGMMLRPRSMCRREHKPLRLGLRSRSPATPAALSAELCSAAAEFQEAANAVVMLDATAG